MSRLSRVTSALFGAPKGAPPNPLEIVAKAVAAETAEGAAPVVTKTVEAPADAVERPRVQDPTRGQNAFTREAWQLTQTAITEGAVTGEFGTIDKVLLKLAEGIDPAAHAEIDLLQRIASGVGEVKAEFLKDVNYQGAPVGGLYTPAESGNLRMLAMKASLESGAPIRHTDRIQIATGGNGNPGPMLVHEAMHAGVSRFIEKNPSHAIVKHLVKLHEIALERAKAIEGEDHVARVLGKEGEWDRTLYGLTDIHEFMSEVVSNNQFRAWLAASEEATTPEQAKFLAKGAKILDELTKLVARIFGIEKPDTLALLNESFKVSKVLLDQATRQNTNKLAQAKLNAKNAQPKAAPSPPKDSKKSLEEIRLRVGSSGGTVHIGKDTGEEELAKFLDTALPEGVSVEDMVGTYFGSRWDSITDLEVRTLKDGRFRIDGHSEYLDTMRTFSTDMKTVHHDWMAVHSKAKGSGFFKNVMRETVSLYEKMGVEKVELEAGAGNGAYTWLRLGFVPNNPTETADLAMKRLQVDLKLREADDNSAVWAEVADLDLFYQKHKSDKFVNQLLIEQSKQYPALQNLLKTDTPMRDVYAKGPLWEGILDLKDKDQMEVFNTYVGRGE